jgi:hypothetical protein
MSERREGPLNFTQAVDRQEHTEDPPGRADHHVLSVIELLDVLPHVGPSDAGKRLDVHVIAEC